MLRSLDLNLLKVFDAVMVERNVTQAAASLFMTQPAVSNAINRLRDSIGDPLFLKIHGGVAPTPRARALWPPVKECLQKLEETFGTVEFDPAKGHAVYRISASDFIAEHFIIPPYLRLQSTAPNVKIHIQPNRVSDAVSLLEKGEIDFVAGVLTDLNEHIRAQPMETLQYAGCLRKGHPLGAQPSAEDFLAARHLGVSLSGGTSLVDRELAERGLKRNLVLQVNQYALVPRLLAETDFVSIIPLQTGQAHPYGEQLELVRLPFSIQPRTISLIWHARSDGSSEHRWVREQLLQQGRSS